MTFLLEMKYDITCKIFVSRFLFGLKVSLMTEDWKGPVYKLGDRRLEGSKMWRCIRG